MRRRWGVLGLIILGSVVSAHAVGQEAVWRSLPIRSEAETRLGLPGGEAEQHLQGMARAPSRPDRIYLSHDVGQIWRSDDNGRTWSHTVCEGLQTRFGQSVQVDPLNADVVFCLVANAYDRFAAKSLGIYRSEDAGRHWSRVLAVDLVDHQRSMQHTIAPDPTTLDGQRARGWYAGIAGQALHRSDDAGSTWHPVHDLKDHRPLYGVQAHPKQAARVYVYSEKGLFASDDGGKTLAPLGNLPRGAVRSLDIDPAHPNDMLATVDGVGLFASTDGGRSFTKLKDFNAQYVVVHPTDRKRINLVGRSNAHMLVSRDAGKTWEVPKVVPIPGWDREKSGWKTKFNGEFSWILPDPRNVDSWVGIANATLYRTDDGGKTLTDSSAGFTGYAWGWFTHAVAFDRKDPDRFAFFCYDVGAVLTENGGAWFTPAPVPWVWKRDGKIEHTGMYAGDFEPVSGSKTIVATAGQYWKQVLVRSENNGQTWTIVDGTPANNLFVAFHPKDPKVVYADDKRSDDGGRTFHRLPGLEPGAMIVGMAESQPDTIYALNRAANAILRSDDRGASWRTYAKTAWAMRKLDSKPTFLVSPGNPDLVYAIDRQGDLASFDGKQWRSLGVLKLAGATDRGNHVRMLTIDPRHPEIIYAGTFAPGGPWLFRSTDGGTSWLDITGNLPRTGVGGLQVHPLTGDVFAGGTEGTRILAPPYSSNGTIYDRLK
jgi:photosystem II stability/assembly factor-like uncharacterized protein